MAFSQYIADAIANWLRGTTFPAVPANVYISLHTAAPGMAGASECADATYARVAVPTAAAQWDAPSTSGNARVTQNANVITFPALTGAVTISHIGQWDALSGGNFIRGGALAAPVAFLAGESPNFPVGDLDLAVGTAL